jgi:hypothetical protein
LFQAVHEAAEGDFEVLGEIVRSADGTASYLAKDLATQALVVLRLTPEAENEYVLDVVRQLDQRVPAPPATCPRCKAGVRGWGRFCTRCGTKLWKARSFKGRWTKPEVLAAVREAVQGKFEILGEMKDARGEGLVYFARDITSGRIEALRLEQEGADDFSIGLTGVLERFAGSISDQHRRR